MEEFRQLEPSRVTQVTSQATHLAAGGRGQPGPPRTTSSPTRLATGPVPKPTAPVGKPEISVAPRDVQVEVAQLAALGEAVRALQVQMQPLLADKALKVEGPVVTQSPSSDLKALRQGLETQLAAQEQKLTKTFGDQEKKMVKAFGDIEQKIAKSFGDQEQKLAKTFAGFEQKWTKFGEQIVVTFDQKLMEKFQVLDALQSDVGKLQELDGERAKKESLAIAAGVESGMGLEDLRIHMDSQFKEYATHAAAIQDVQNLMREQYEKTGAIDAELQHFRVAIETNAKRQSDFSQELKVLQETQRETYKVLMASREEQLEKPQGLTHAETVEIVNGSVQRNMDERCTDMQDRQEQQAEILRTLQDELLSLARQQRDASKALSETSVKATDLSAEIQGLQGGMHKQHAELADMCASLSQTVSTFTARFDENLAKVGTAVKSETLETQQLELKEIRRNMEMKLEQQEQIIKAIRSHLGATEEKMEQLLSQPKSQSDSHAILDDLDALKKELLAQRHLQASELEREADALHTHVHKAVSEERDSRQLETARCQALVNSVQGELSKISGELRLSNTRAMPTQPVVSENLPPLECINSKSQLDKTHYIGPAKK